MKSIYDEFFYVPKEGKVREKVMLVRLAVSVALMIACLAAMSISAYAYFACNVSSTYNIIQGTNFEAVVSVVTVVDETDTPVPVVTASDQTHIAVLEGGVTYTVKIVPIGTATTGFCVVSADGCDKVYHTQQLGVVEGQPVPEMTFKVKPSGNTNLKIFAHWGTSSYYDAYTNKGENDELYILDGEELALTIAVDPNATTLPDDDGEDATTTTTESGAEDTTTAPSVEDTTTLPDDSTTTTTDAGETTVTTTTVTSTDPETMDTTAAETE